MLLLFATGINKCKWQQEQILSNYRLKSGAEKFSVERWLKNEQENRHCRINWLKLQMTRCFCRMIALKINRWTDIVEWSLTIMIIDVKLWVRVIYTTTCARWQCYYVFSCLYILDHCAETEQLKVTNHCSYLLNFKSFVEIFCILLSPRHSTVF